jgi:hypothetical protein
MNLHIKYYGDLELHVHWTINEGEPQTYDHPGEARHVEIEKIEAVKMSRDRKTIEIELDITEIIYSSPHIIEFEQSLREEIQEKYEI